MKVTYEIADPKRFSEERLRQMWRLRLTFMDLKPTVAPEDDFQSFAKFFRAGTYGVLFHDPEQRLVGFFGVALETRRAAGKSYVAMIMEYTFMEEAYHGHPAMLKARIDVSLRALLYKPWLPRYAIGLAYPATAVTLSGAYPGAVALGQEGLTAFHRAALEDHARRAGGERWDPSLHVLSMNTLPRRPVRVPRSPSNRAAYEAFLQLNPRWKEGYCLVMMGPFGLHTFLHPLRRMLAKAARGA